MATDLTQILELGTLLVIETGEYSDKQWNGPVRMLISISKGELVERFRADWKPESWQDPEDGPEPGGFLPWLVASRYAEHVDAHSWHVGSYGRFEP
jgi:hypothetical protein